MEIIIFKKTGNFAENKDVARDLREQVILPHLEKGEEITLNFEGVSSATQSFIHALISDVIRKHGESVFDKVIFKSCNAKVKKLIQIVADYMQAGM